MSNKKTDYISSIFLIGVLLLVVEITFFNRGVIFSSLLSIACIYFGRKKLERTIGKLLFWFGWVSLFFTIFAMMTVKFLLIAIILYFIIQYYQSKKSPSYLKPVLQERDTITEDDSKIKRQPLFENVLFGQQKTAEEVYEWNDVNIQNGIGDTTIDLSYTVLPKEEAVIFIRHFIGNVQIYVPYEVEVSVIHSVIAGSTTIFQHSESKIFNQTLFYKTPEYEHAGQKIKIVTSMIIGDLEVKRI